MVLQNINKNLFLLSFVSIFWFQSELQLCFSILSLQIRLDTFFFLPSKLSSTIHECRHFTLVAKLAEILINIATCCEGHKIEIQDNNSTFFRIATSPCGCFLSFHIAMLQLANISHQVQQFRAVMTAQAVLSTTCGGSTALSLLLMRVFWMHQHGRRPEMHLTLM